MEPLSIPLRPLLIFLVVLARVGGVVTFAPFWSNKVVTSRVRAVLAMMVALVVTPIVSTKLPTPPTEFMQLVLVLGGELIIGFILGFAGRLIFSALEVAATAVGFQMGLSLASTIDPATQAQTAALGMLAQMFGLMVLIGADGHHYLLEVTIHSFQFVAPGNFHINGAMAEIMIRLAADAFAMGVALAAPAVVILLAVETVLAVAGRVAPKLEVMILGFPLKIAVGLWLLGASIFFLPGAIRAIFSSLRNAVTRLLGAL